MTPEPQPLVCEPLTVDIDIMLMINEPGPKFKESDPMNYLNVSEVIQ